MSLLRETRVEWKKMDYGGKASSKSILEFHSAKKEREPFFM